MSDAPQGPDAGNPIEDQVREQTGQQQVRLRVDESKLETTYANAFRTNTSAEEVIIDFGLNLVVPPTQQEATPEIRFQANERIILNYYSAKRLALALGQVIRRHEEQFGELEMDVNKRRQSG
jgi:hypothetical protein